MAAAVLTAACAAPEPRPYSIVTPHLSCERAQQLSQQVMERLRYTVSVATPATSHTAGLLRGVRPRPQGPGEESVSVKITCGADGVHVDANPDVPPCEQANQLTRQSVEQLGYSLSSFTPAVMNGRRGVVQATKADAGKQDVIMLTITCTDEAVFVDTQSDNPVVMSANFASAITDFRRGFFSLFKPMADAEPRKTGQ